MSARTADVVIIGGGVIGTAIAYYLTKLGVRPVLLERGDICAGTSGACDKAISMQSKNPGLHLDLALESSAMFPSLGEELGADLDYHRYGGMIAIENERQMAIMEKFVERQQSHGLPVEILGGDEARRRQPALSPAILAATYSPADAEVSPLKLTFAFARAARRGGADLRTGTEVRGLLANNGRVEGVVTGSGAVKAGVVVNAAGVFAPAIGRMAGLELPIKPRRGQIIVTEPMPPIIRGEIWSARYIVAKYNPEMIRSEDPEAADLGVGLAAGQTPEGTLLIGGTREFVGYDTTVTPEATAAVLRHAVSVLPVLAKVHVIRTFAGLRPYTPDGMPILGPVDGLEGFVMAAGHEGDGIALAPKTGKMIAEYIAGAETDKRLRELTLSRFQQV
jgi:glycine/D-amino acid oxidase-like deaminating enzyme